MDTHFAGTWAIIAALSFGAIMMTRPAPAKKPPMPVERAHVCSFMVPQINRFGMPEGQFQSVPCDHLPLYLQWRFASKHI